VAAAGPVLDLQDHPTSVPVTLLPELLLPAKATYLARENKRTILLQTINQYSKEQIKK
jgi:hypothetical protein